jgi:hypothetical protein
MGADTLFVPPKREGAHGFNGAHVFGGCLKNSILPQRTQRIDVENQHFVFFVKNFVPFVVKILTAKHKKISMPLCETSVSLCEK